MESKLITVTNKGQISLPTKIRNSLCIKQGDKLILIQNNNSIVLKKFKAQDFSDLLKHSEEVAQKLWNNKEDEVWNEI